MMSFTALPRAKVAKEPLPSRCARPLSKRSLVVSAAVPPSSATAANALEKLQRYSVILPVEGINKAQTGADASSTAVVNFAVLQELVANASMIEYVNAIERAVSFTKQNGGSTNEALDAALVNVGMMLKECVTGRIVVEVDPRLAHDADGLVKRARTLVKSFESQGCGTDKLLLQLPASWEGLQAVAKLEKVHRIQCEVTRVFSFPQGVQAIKAGASVVLTDIRRIDAWYDKYPGVIRDPSAPRQDVGVMVPSQSSVGIRIATAIYNYAQQQGGRTKVVVGGIRTPEEAVQLSGIDYMLLPESVKSALAATDTLQGYNDGLSAAVSIDDRDDIPALTPAIAAKWKFKPSETTDLSKEAFDAELGMAGADLLAASLLDGIESTDRIARFVDNYAVAQV